MGPTSGILSCSFAHAIAKSALVFLRVLKPNTRPTIMIMISHHQWIRTSEKPIMNFVSPGRSPPKSLYTPANCGRTNTVRMITTMITRPMRKAGYISALLILPVRAISFLQRSAHWSNASSRRPFASPASMMLIYIGGKPAKFFIA